jgi:hypothetical protein
MQFFFRNVFDLHLVEATGAEPADTQGWLNFEYSNVQRYAAGPEKMQWVPLAEPQYAGCR